LIVTLYLVSVLITLLSLQASLHILTKEGMKFPFYQIVTGIVIAFIPVINLMIILGAFSKKDETK
jgi:hypothetical protein